MIERYLNRVGRLLEFADIPISPRKFLWFNAWFSILGSAFMILIHYQNPMLAAFSYVAMFALINLGIFGFLMIVKNRRAEVSEEALPDYLLLFSNNIRSGYTPEEAMIVSAKSEFGVLSAEVGRIMKGGMSGKPVEGLLPRISERLDSQVIRNTFSLIVEGMLSGGDLPKLLEQTSYDIRKFEAVRKDVRSVISVYELFIAAAAGFAAPLLIGTSVFIMNVTVSIRSKISPSKLAAGKGFFFNPAEIGIDPTGLLVFSFASIFVITFFASMAIGLIGKGKRIEGLKYFPLLFAIAAAVLIIIRGLLEVGLGGLFRV
jgi:archaellum biogenesis protein FlaJ (TadC family)